MSRSAWRSRSLAIEGEEIGFAARVVIWITVAPLGTGVLGESRVVFSLNFVLALRPLSSGDRIRRLSRSIG